MRVLHRVSVSRRVLIAGVGYTNLRDLSVGPVLVERLSALDWPEGVEVEDLGYGPIGVMHALGERPPYDRMIFVAGAKGAGPPGSIRRYEWEHALPPQEELQQRMVEAATGVIDLHNLLVIGTYFGRLPRDVIVFEIEAGDDSYGESLSPAVERAAGRLVDEIRAALEGG